MSKWIRKVQRRLAQLDSAKQTCKTEMAALRKAEARLTAFEEAQALAQQIAQEVQSQAHSQIASIVTRCLASVFEEPYTFEIRFERKRGRTEAVLVFCKDGMDIDPLTASGGGVVDVAAFALRLACLRLSRPPLRRLLVLDEPFRFVSPDYRQKVRTLLETLATEMDMQIIMITHDRQLNAGTVVDTACLP